MAATLHDPRYKVLIRALIDARKASGLSQYELAALIDRPQSYIGKIETFERRLDALEMFDLLDALTVSAGRFAADMAPRLRSKPRTRKSGS